MSKIEAPFHIDEEAEFRFTLSLQSSSVNAHSLMDSDDNKKELNRILNDLAKDTVLRTKIKMMIPVWKEKHR